MNLKKLILYYFILLTAIVSFAQDKKDCFIPESEYQLRINSVLNMLDSGAAVVLESAGLIKRTHDTEYKFRQESNLLYLTGINKPSYNLILIKDGWMIGKKHCRSILLCPTANNEDISGPYPNVFDTVLPINYYYKQLDSLLPHTKTLYYSSPESNEFKITVKEKHPEMKVLKALVLLSVLREIKSENEIKMIRRSIELTEAGIINAMKVCKPGIWEYELQAEIEYESTKGGAAYMAYPCIIGSGPNSLILHYSKNNRQTKENELVVMDVGAEYEGYASDITRTIPVSGKFTVEQKEVYSVVLEAHKEILKSIKPGISFYQLDLICRSVFKKHGYENYMVHGVAHSVGIDVHDPLSAFVLKPGMIITVEPGIYIPANDKSKPEAYRGFGIRIEDDVLITTDGCEVLSKGVPKEIEEIEQLMKKD